MNAENKRIVTSAALVKALNDIGVNKKMIELRRVSRLYIEAFRNINDNALGIDFYEYIVGSDSEGTTTKGMNSDTDTLYCNKEIPVIHDFADWQFGRVQFFVKTDISTPPQCCFLYLVSPNNPEFVTEMWQPWHHKDAQGRVFLKNIFLEMAFEGVYEEWGIDYIRHGPSRCIYGDRDLVYAFYCAKLPENCQYIFRRQKSGHWPRLKLLTQLKDSGVFIVYEHVENTTHWDPCQHIGTLTVRRHDHSHELHWRLSTNLMERLLMFDLTVTQLKVYVVMKMIRKEFYKPLVGDRLSTFHLKTALLYSVERSPPCIWEDENLIECLKLCLTTLKRWLKVRYCPHYTTANVNLFSGKLQLNEFPVLVKLFTDMIRNDVSCLHDVKMDDLGNRISSYSTDGTIGLPCEKLDIVLAETFLTDLLEHVCIYPLDMFGARETSKVINVHARFIQNLEAINNTRTGKIRSAVSIVLPFHYSLHAAMKASLCIGQNLRIPQEIFTLCEKSLTSDVTSSRLKLASIMISSRRFIEADIILRQVDALITKNVMHYSPFRKSEFDPELLERRKGFPDIMQNKIALCTIFDRHEINCVPGQLVAEFYRTVTVEDAERRHPLDFSSWMELVVVDSRTCLYYLKYLSLRHIGLISDQHSAYDYFHDYVFSNVKNRVFSHKALFGHVETSLNLLGHCCELEGELSNAWDCYHISVRLQPHNNAAYWHMFRMIGELFYGPNNCVRFQLRNSLC